ncbi:MAG: MFS transporter [Clostridia bacterium]|nr:MFS transporter [Clostridia bacterium]
MKLNVKRTALIGLGFLTIMMLWQVYNWMVPLFLKDFFNEITNSNDLYIGIIMALDNLFALFMIPLMSHFSDKTKSKMGRRMPYITAGILLSAGAFMLLPLIRTTGSVVLLIANILLVLVFMNIYRSPCVALMPDVTPKPLRNKGNSIINIMGGFGYAIGFLSILFFSKTEILPFIIVAVIMVICLVVMLLKIRENKFVADYLEQLRENGIDEEEDKKEEEEKGSRAKTLRRNVLLSLLVVFATYMSSNSVETFMSLYSKNVFTGAQNIPFGMDAGALAMIPFGVANFAFAYPAAYIADKIGRRYTVMIGAILMTLAYGGIGLFADFSYVLLLFFAIGGAGFALIAINIYPMVVENCSAKDTGKYTGLYYTASMLAQSVTPALSGLLIGNVFHSYSVLFPYAMVFSILVAVILIFMKNDKKTVTISEK